MSYFVEWGVACLAPAIAIFLLVPGLVLIGLVLVLIVLAAVVVALAAAPYLLGRFLLDRWRALSADTPMTIRSESA